MDVFPQLSIRHAPNNGPLFGLEPTERLLHLFEPGETVFVVPEFAVLILNEECDSDLRVEAILPEDRHAAEIGHHRKRLPDEAGAVRGGSKVY